MPPELDKKVVAITDKSLAGRIVVRRAIRLAEILNVPVDIHHVLNLPNGENTFDSGSIERSIDELIEAEKDLSQALHDAPALKNAHASVDPGIWEEEADLALITFLTEGLHARVSLQGMSYLAFADSQKKLDLSQVALLCAHDSDRTHLVQLAEIMNLTQSDVRIILEEGVGNLTFWNDLVGDLRLTNQPLETYNNDAGLRKIIKQHKPSLICLPSGSQIQDRVEWLRKIHGMDILIY